MSDKLNTYEYYSKYDMPIVFKSSDNTLIDERFSVDGVTFDGKKLFPKLMKLNKFAIKIYLCLVNHLESNDKPITLRNSQINLQATQFKHIENFVKHMNALLETDLVRKTGMRTYYINPVYAQKGHWAKLFDPDYIPYYTREELDELEARHGKKP